MTQNEREVRSLNPQAVQSAMEIGDPAADPPVGIRPLHIGETSPTFVDTRDHLYDQGGSGKAPSRQSQSSCGIRLPSKSPNSWGEDKIVLACEDAKRQWGSLAEPGIFSQIIICLFCMRKYSIYRSSSMWTQFQENSQNLHKGYIINSEIHERVKSLHLKFQWKELYSKWHHKLSWQMEIPTRGYTFNTPSSSSIQKYPWSQYTFGAILSGYLI